MTTRDPKSSSSSPSTTSLAARLVEPPLERQDVQEGLLHPAHQVYFRAGLLACREYMARFVEAESPSIAMSIRANWWPSLGQDFGPPRKLKWGEVTDGEYGTPGFRVKTAEEVSPTQEALPVALGFLESQQPGSGLESLQAGRLVDPSPPQPAICKECGCQTGGGVYCYEHAPYTITPLKDGSYYEDRNGSRKRCSGLPWPESVPHARVDPSPLAWIVQAQDFLAGYNALLPSEKVAKGTACAIAVSLLEQALRAALLDPAQNELVFYRCEACGCLMQTAGKHSVCEASPASWTRMIGRRIPGQSSCQPMSTRSPLKG